MFGLRMPELIIILVVILLIFGPKNLPKIGSALGKTVRGVREGIEGNGAEEFEEPVIEEVEEAPKKTPPRKTAQKTK
ncbi:MAG: twin-arginine translocase TatA/TatE family subunit [Coriobacteriales bacterium]|jgi:sec-independent protein translocase protein TatA|nr:twin-arginine translocase TatA/TatE family subunit [Coriobacteriales bacterium]